MASVTVIGRGAHVTGRVTGSVDLEIQGRVDGEIAIGGEATIEAEGLVAANVSARRLVVRGAVKGDLSAEESIILESGAKVLGDVRAPRVAIGQGALVRGYVETGEAGAAVPRPQARSSGQTNALRAPTPQVIGKPARPQPRPEPLAAREAGLLGEQSRPGPSAQNRPGRSPNALLAGVALPVPKPPEPVVPVLKKGARR